MKQLIKRRLPLDVKYIVTDKRYIPVLDGGGCTCDNCGKLIANIATVKSINGNFNIGFDCLETFLLNNSLLDGFNLEEYEKVKSMIPKVIRFSKNIKEVIGKCQSVTGLLFETPMFGDFFTFYYLHNGMKESRNNDYVKLKNMDFQFLIETLKNIFPKLDIIIKP